MLKCFLNDDISNGRIVMNLRKKPYEALQEYYWVFITIPVEP